MKAIGFARKLGLLAIGVFVTVMLAACQSGPPKISISGAKAELSPAIVGEAMVTMSIRNDGGSEVLERGKDRHTGRESIVSCHAGRAYGDMDTVDVPAKNNLKFQMGGSHIMIEDMPKTMRKGSKIN